MLMMMKKTRKNSVKDILIDLYLFPSLWKYQQEINHLSESEMIATNNNNNNHSNYILAKRFKKFRCPHCEHS